MMDNENHTKEDNALYGLIAVYSKIYDLYFDEMYNLEVNNLINSSDFQKCLVKLNLLKAKEKRILNTITIYKIDEVSDTVNDFCDMLIDDPEKKSYIIKRINNIINQEIVNEHDEDMEMEDKIMQKTISLVNYVMEDYIRSLSNDDNEINALDKYILAFTFPNVEDDLIIGGFKSENLIKISDDIRMKLLALDKEHYKEYQKTLAVTYVVNYANELLNDDIDSELQSIYLNRLKFFIPYVETAHLTSFDNAYNLVANFGMNENHNLNKVHDLVIEELETRDDVTLVQGKQLSMATINQLFNIIKIVNHNIKQFNKIDFTSQDSVLAYQKSLDYEEKIMLEIIDNYYDSDLFDLVENALKIIVPDANEHTQNLIKDRLLSYLEEPGNDMYASMDIPYYITLNQTIKSLKVFEKLIAQSKGDELKSLIQFKNDKILANYKFTKSYMEAQGKIDALTILDDETLCDLLDINFNEYIFDKNELLIEDAYDLIEEITMYPDRAIDKLYEDNTDYLKEFLLDNNIESLNKINSNEAKAKREYQKIYLNILGQELYPTYVKKMEEFYLTKNREFLLKTIQEIITEKEDDTVLDIATKFMKTLQKNLDHFYLVDFNNVNDTEVIKEDLNYEQELFNEAVTTNPNLCLTFINTYLNMIEDAATSNLMALRIQNYVDKKQNGLNEFSPAENNIVMQNQKCLHLKAVNKRANELKGDLKEALYGMIYAHILADPDLTYKYIEAKGNIDHLLVLNEQTAASILSITPDEYVIDKNFILYEYCKPLLTELLRPTSEKLDIYDLAEKIYHQLDFNVATLDMSDQMVSDLYDTVEKTFAKTLKK